MTSSLANAPSSQATLICMGYNMRLCCLRICSFMLGNYPICWEIIRYAGKLSDMLGNYPTLCLYRGS
ncbi:TPA: hypothetical protein EYN65_22535 [Candidatus Poribacteria bacterium]|nr:hypothetical protein [Candidatus Poribacteria bacterium]